MPLCALHKSHSACEAGVSIKPGVQAPGSDHKRQAGARENGRQREISSLSPAVAGSGPFIFTLTWGLRPRLYAYACYRRLRNIIPFRLFVQSLSQVVLTAFKFDWLCTKSPKVPPTAVGGWLRSFLVERTKNDLRIPPTAVGGSFKSFRDRI